MLARIYRRSVGAHHRRKQVRARSVPVGRRRRRDHVHESSSIRSRSCATSFGCHPGPGAEESSISV
jgi:hypothetical protein